MNVKRAWDHFALLLVDAQQDFWTKRVAQSCPHFPENITRLLTSCPSEGIEIVHRRARFKPDMSDWMNLVKQETVRSV